MIGGCTFAHLGAGIPIVTAVTEATVDVGWLAITVWIVATHNRTGVIDILPNVVGPAFTGIVFDVDAIAVGIVFAFEPIDTLSTIGTPDVVNVAVAATTVAIGTVAVRVVAADDRAS